MTNHKRLLFKKLLRDNNHSITTSRQIVFDLLDGQEPQSMHALIQRAAGQVDRVSIYRIIALYEKIGIVHRVTIGWKYKIELSDIFLEHHHHLSCTLCKKVIVAKESPQIEASIRQLSKTHGFTLTNHQLELQGYCQKCRAQL